MSSADGHASTELPAVDERLVAPESRYEIDDGRLVHVAPADEDHAVNHGAIGALLRAHRRDDFEVAVDMLTRVTRLDDIAPDASVYPRARDERTGGRQLEQLAFELLATDRLGAAGGKAAKLVARGVRRVFAVDVLRHRAFEWSRELGTWSMLAASDRIDDPALAIPLPIAALVNAAVADDASVRAYRAKRHPEFLAEREEGRAEGRAEGQTTGRAEGLAATLRMQLVEKFGKVSPAHEARIAAATPEALERSLRRILTAPTSDAVLED